VFTKIQILRELDLEPWSRATILLVPTFFIGHIRLFSFWSRGRSPLPAPLIGLLPRSTVFSWSHRLFSCGFPHFLHGLTLFFLQRNPSPPAPQIIECKNTPPPVPPPQVCFPPSSVSFLTVSWHPPFPDRTGYRSGKLSIPFIEEISPSSAYFLSL